MLFISVLLQFVIYYFASGEIFKEVFKVRSGNYRAFYTVDYKFINIPSNLYDLNISFKLIRWIGYLPLCPSSVNVTSMFQFGNFPLFSYDKKFQYNNRHLQKIEMFIPKAEKRNSRVFKLQSPLPGTWLFGSIYQNNDDYHHPVYCLLDLQVTLTGFIFKPSSSIYLPSTGKLLKIPFHMNKPGGQLLEILSDVPLSNVRISHTCRTCHITVTSGNKISPQTTTLKEARNSGRIFKYNETIFYTVDVETSHRFLINIQSWTHEVIQTSLRVEYATVQSDVRAVMFPALMKIRGDSLFSFKFRLPDLDQSNVPVTLEHGKVTILPFFIEPIKDQGSRLNIDISMKTMEVGNYTIHVCIGSFGLTDPSTLLAAVINSARCVGSASRSMSNAGKLTFHFEYPEWSWWYITMMVESPTVSIRGNVSVFSKSCLHHFPQCNHKGNCLLTGVDTGLVSSCHCYKPFYGLDCLRINKPDISKKKTNIYRRDWLVFSNFAFIPAVIIAAVQRVYVLILIYLFTAGFSMVYHMCYMEDTDLAFCALNVERLAYYDHLAAVISIWMTMVSLSTLPYKVQMCINVIMVFVCVVMADVIQKSIWFYCLPISIAVVIVVACWIFRMNQLKCIFPPLDWWVFGLLPGLVIASIGFMMFRLSIKQQYAYYFYHSIWHMFIALSICFVLPNTKRWKKALGQTTSEEAHSRPFQNLPAINSQRWYKFKKDLNYYLHLDVLLNPLLERNSKWSICKSY